jgi:hypothetical protein
MCWTCAPGAASSGGITFGAGTTTTLTPEDGEAILKECPAVRNVAPLVHHQVPGHGRGPERLQPERLQHFRQLGQYPEQQSLFSTEDALVQSTTAVSTNLVALYKALGGGWSAASQRNGAARDAYPPAD